MEFIDITAMNGWVFKQGSDSTWANNALNTSNWKNIGPSQINADYTDKMGRLEGWFRLKIRLDESFENHLAGLGFDSRIWAASDVYLNGRYLDSFGSTVEMNGNKYESNTFKGEPINLYLQTDTEYLIAIHVVDYLHPIPSVNKELRSGSNLEQLLVLTSAEYRNNIISDEKSSNNLLLILTAIIGVITLFFWLIYFQNTDVKHLQRISISILFLFIFLTISTIQNIFRYDFIIIFIFDNIATTSILIFLLELTFSVIILFKKHVLKYQLYVGYALILLSSLDILFIPYDATSYFHLSITLLFIITFFYYIYTSKHQATGSQKVLIYSIAAPFTFLLIILIAIFLESDILTNIIFVLLVMSFPVGLLLYISAWLKESNYSIANKAKEILKITEEKRELLANQNLVLEQHVNERTDALRRSLEELKATQDQLVQQEKLASLGQLTAGIAHEIKNPLNFVNNFSDLSMELIDEAFEELKALGENEKAQEAMGILEDVKSNLSKIHEHGTRADSIVKSMLLHSRGSDGKMEPTALNALVKEYVNLTFHGMRAGKNPINVDIKYELDESIGQVPLIAEDFSRVIVNLCNNAFDAMREKGEIRKREKSEGEIYLPKLTVRTHRNGGAVCIEIEDNGPGISDDMKDKILQPFFTTKKGTQGTGLGLSITNDIIKAHGGKLQIDSDKDISTKFTIKLNKG
jgi:signal transduction histidine kinase